MSVLFMNLALQQPDDIGPLAQLVIIAIGILGSTTLMVLSKFQHTTHTIFDNQTASIHLARKYIHKKESYEVPFSNIKDIKIIVSKDSDGDPYYKLKLFTISGHNITLKEGNSEEYIKTIELKCKQYLEHSNIILPLESSEGLLED